MPGIKPASAPGLGAPPVETMVAGMKTEEEVETPATMTAMILPEQVEDEEGTRTTTVVIEETPEGTIIQQHQQSASVEAHEAHVKPVQVMEQQQQQRVIQIQAAEGQDITGIPVKILQDATTADGQKISIIRIAGPEEEDDAEGATAIMQGGTLVQDGQQVFVSGGVTFTRQQVDSNSVEIVMSGQRDVNM